MMTLHIKNWDWWALKENIYLNAVNITNSRRFQCSGILCYIDSYIAISVLKALPNITVIPEDTNFHQHQCENLKSCITSDSHTYIAMAISDTFPYV
jgi:hypothetical protein